MAASILWHDYETWGVNPKHDFPVQFAAIRTDLDLNVIDKPINYFCQIPNDYLPHPQACLVTGITPQQSLRDGFIECEFASKVLQHIKHPETCTAGYNSIKFDEEVTRNLLYRNFYSVYEREYENGNSRWDIIDLVRAAYALRPEGINWSYYENGKPCFKLEVLSQENGLEHESAHDALSDVYATIAVAKLIKQKQPKLYDYYWQLRDKRKVLAEIDVVNQTPFLHISGYINSIHGCCAWLMPICQHPVNKNVIIAVNLAKDIDGLASLSLDDLDDDGFIEQLYQNKQLPLMQISINKVPFVAHAKTLTEENANRLNIDREGCLANYRRLKQMSDLAAKCERLSQRSFADSSDLDIDAQLYTREFPSPADKQLMNQIRDTDPEALSSLYQQLESSLYKRQLFRYLGRNFPDLMNEQQLNNWQMHRRERFVHGASGYLSMASYQQQIEMLVQQHAQDTKKMALLKQLELYASGL
ncbi:exodeoxyribonuclease I [Glaciecola siphonariae]|uniref:Exodeoxyribonuclease I n=1 Tax=Glaciecola siphonariae TaxID=521012 RepID=A0ABV9LTK7_9ALTE